MCTMRATGVKTKQYNSHHLCLDGSEVCLDVLRLTYKNGIFFFVAGNATLEAGDDVQHLVVLAAVDTGFVLKLVQLVPQRLGAAQHVRAVDLNRRKQNKNANQEAWTFIGVGAIACLKLR